MAERRACHVFVSPVQTLDDVDEALRDRRDHGTLKGQLSVFFFCFALVLTSKKLKPEKAQRPKNSRIFQPETQRSGSDSNQKCWKKAWFPPPLKDSD